MEKIQVQLKRKVGPFSVGVWLIIIVAGVSLGFVARRKFFPAPKGGKDDTSGSGSQAFPSARVGVSGAPNIIQLPPIETIVEVEVEGPERIVTETVIERDETLVKEQEGIIRQLRDRTRKLISEREGLSVLNVSLTEQVNSLFERFKLSEPTTTTKPTLTTVAPVVDDSTIPTSTGTRYVVRSGDTLSKIGARFGVPWRVIYDANRAVIGSNPDLIKPGQILVIPKAA